MYCSKCISIGANNSMRIAQNCLNCWKSFSGKVAAIPQPNGPLLLMMMGRTSSSKASVICEILSIYSN
jgi:hypothetical protein